MAMKCCDTVRVMGLLMAAIAAGCAEPDGEIAQRAQANAKAGGVDLVKLADERLAAARVRFQAAMTVDESAWRLGSACFDRAEFCGKDNTLRAKLAREGIEACRKLVAAQPAVAAGYYYLGMNMGQLARVKQLSALGMVKDMVAAFDKARALDATFSNAGPDRNLGLLYYKAPGWPLSIGNKKKARHHLLRAVELAPDFPPNRLSLLEALEDWDDDRAAAEQRRALKQLWPKARKKFAGPDWALDWADWNARWQKLRAP